MWADDDGNVVDDPAEYAEQVAADPPDRHEGDVHARHAMSVTERINAVSAEVLARRVQTPEMARAEWEREHDRHVEVLTAKVAELESNVERLIDLIQTFIYPAPAPAYDPAASGTPVPDLIARLDAAAVAPETRAEREREIAAARAEAEAARAADLAEGPDEGDGSGFVDMSGWPTIEDRPPFR